MSDICEGLNVLELGAGSVASSMTGMVLADAGARVVKVEPPEGDRLRTANPSGFLVWNRGKESLVADLCTPQGQATVRELAAAADVVIDAFAPGRSRSWGIDADALRAVNERLVHCSITGFGTTGAYAKVKGYDELVAAKVGLWSRGSFGHRDGPSMAPVAWGSFGAAMQSVAGILGALRVRERTGRGQALDATLVGGLDPIEYFVGTILQLMVKKGEKPAVDARAPGVASRYAVLLATKDGRFIQTTTMLPHQGRALCEVAGIAHVMDEPRFQRAPMFDTVDDAQAWEDLLLEAFRSQDLAYWRPRLEASPDVAFEIAVTSEEGLEHPQVVHNGDVIEIDDPEVGPVRQVGPIGHFSATPIRPSRSAPALGVHEGPLAKSSAPGGTGAAPDHPFAGVTIVEFGYFYAMPYGTAMAAALGARVIKIEDAKGDPHRTSFGPEVASNKTTAAKESVSLDLKTPEGQAIAQKIVEHSDVFVTSFRSGVAEKLGLGYDDLRRRNPRLLYVHAAGYGSDGPYAHRALYAQSAQAVAGSFGRQVGAWYDPARNVDMSLIELQAVVLPRLAQIVDGDSNAALALLAALSLGIYHQQRTGEGQRLMTSMIGGNVWAYSDDFCRYEGKPAIPLCDEEYFGTHALNRLYRAADDTWLCLSVHTDREFDVLARALGSPGLVDDERFSSADGRAKHDDELITLLSTLFSKQTALAWEAQLAEAGCAAVSMEGQAAFTSFDPVLRETGLTVAIDHPMFGEMVRAAPPIRFSETPARVAPPCFRGQQNRKVLAELGYDEREIAELESAGVVIPRS